MPIGMVVQKTFRALLTVLALVTFVFVILRVSGDPAVEILGVEAGPEALEAYREKWGLNKPIWEQYIYYFANMLQGDLDLQYAFFHETSVRAVAFGGGNFTYIGSTFEALIDTNNEDINDASDYSFGGNVGAGLELRMAPKLDFNVSAKYLFSRYSQFIISVQAVYFFKVRRRAYRR